MNRESIREICREIMGPNFHMQNLGNWVSMPCMLAPWKHAKGVDKNPSAGVSVADTDTSVFNCFTCGTRVPFHHLVRMYGDYSGKDLDHLVEEIEENEYLGPVNPGDWDAIRAARMEEMRMPLDEVLYLDLYDSAEGHPYLKERGISKATARKLELKFDPSDPVDGSPRILFPVRGEDGLLYGFSGRDVSGKADLKVRDYGGMKKAHNILGAHFLADAKEITIVEGLFDYASMHELGEVGAAIMHAHITDAQLEILRSFNARYFVLLDDDQAGRDGTIQLCKGLHEYGTVLTSTYPKVWIEDDSEAGGHWLKDPGEMTREELTAMKARAEMYVDPALAWRYAKGRRR